MIAKYVITDEERGCLATSRPRRAQRFAPVSRQESKMTARNYDIAELRRLDVAHHLAAQQDQGLMRDLGGARIITRAEGCTIYDGDGQALLDGMAGLWCVQVGY